ncbi:hypothetical protein GCM10010387_16320 [Streptomyces inusitatus]|uniref:Helix-turn-helix domain-containing protein n=1 Tax=Streptomyces inusitatus TaxID=68221 RepID=A0A918UP38_9ACTN|nr:helix-turn-helix domain-containing protein [Streptomyces inusitatus]GGZ23819.1 hypothetical protein GCM10010387_16320 [Streptomyces inusitatus]
MNEDQDQESVRRGVRGPQVRRPRLKGEVRDQLRAAVAAGYASGSSIRALAAEHGLSFGLTRILLIEAEVPLRTRVRRPGAAE